MKSEKGFLVYWEDDECDRIIKTEVKLKKTKYVVNPVAKWLPVIAAEDKPLRAGHPEMVRVEKISLPENVICAPLKIMRHGLGTLLALLPMGKPRCIEEEKHFTRVVFMPAFDGEIKTGDLLGVLLAHFLHVGIDSGADPRSIDDKTHNARFAYWRNDQLVREEVQIEATTYLQSNVYEWVPIISATSTDIRKGELKVIDTQSFEIPRNTIVDSLFVMRNALGDVIGVFRPGKPKKIETTRTISKVLFLGARDGRIEKGDLLEVASLHYVMVDEPHFEPLKREVTANIVYQDRDSIVRDEVHLEPHGHEERTSKGRWAYVVAAETRKLEKGKAVMVKIKDIVFEPGTVVAPLFAMRYALGVLLDVSGEGKPQKIEKRQRVTQAFLLPVFDGKVKEGEILGMLRVQGVKVTSGDKLYSLLGKVADKLVMDSGQFEESSEWPHLWRKS